MLWYPLAWFHYDVALMPVALLAGATAIRQRSRITALMVATYAAMRFIPPYAGIPGSVTWVPLIARLFLLLACVSLYLLRKKE